MRDRVVGGAVWQAGQVIWDVVRSRRDQLGWTLLGFVAAYLVINFLNLFVAPGFAANSWALNDAFVAPWLSLLLAATVALSVWGQPSNATRTLVVGALGCIGVALLLGVISWVGALVLDDQFLVGVGAGRTMLSLHFVVRAFLLGLVGYLTWLVLRALPAPASSTLPRGTARPPGSSGQAAAGGAYPHYGGYREGGPLGDEPGRYGPPAPEPYPRGQQPDPPGQWYEEQYGHTYGRPQPRPSWPDEAEYPPQPPGPAYPGEFGPEDPQHPGGRRYEDPDER